MYLNGHDTRFFCIHTCHLTSVKVSRKPQKISSKIDLVNDEKHSRVKQTIRIQMTFFCQIIISITRSKKIFFFLMVWSSNVRNGILHWGEPFFGRKKTRWPEWTTPPLASPIASWPIGQRQVIFLTFFPHLCMLKWLFIMSGPILQWNYLHLILGSNFSFCCC